MARRREVKPCGPRPWLLECDDMVPGVVCGCRNDVPKIHRLRPCSPLISRRCGRSPLFFQQEPEEIQTQDPGVGRLSKTTSTSQLKNE